MIGCEAKLHIEYIPLEGLQVIESGKPHTCYPEKFHIYLDLLTRHPDDYTEPLIVKPSPTHAGMFAIENGKHRYCAYIMAGRQNALCVVVEEKKA